MNNNDYKIFNKNDDKIKALQNKKIDIEKLKKELKQKKTTHKQRSIEISKALDYNFMIELNILKLTEFTQTEKLAKALPYEATKKTTSNRVNNDMRMKKLKGINWNIRALS